jgi:hypothetical protein
VRIREHQFDIPLVERGDLAGKSETDDMLLKAEAGNGSYPLLFGMNWDPVPFSKRIDY